MQLEGQLGYPLQGDGLYGGAPGTVYLEHIILGHLDFATLKYRVHFDELNLDRDCLDPNMWQLLRKLIEVHGASVFDGNKE